MATTLKSYQGQIASIRQPDFSFPEGNLFDLIKQNSIFKDQRQDEKTFIISRIGIVTEPGNIVSLGNYVAGSSFNDEVKVEIGKTGIYQANDIKIKSIKFQNKTGNEIKIKNTIIDYIIQEV